MPFTYNVVSGASADRLEKLIAERLAPGADKASIDRRIWRLFGEKWAVLYTDLSGFSRNVAEFGIIHFLQTIYESHRLLVPIIEKSNGILLKTEGDSLIVMFRHVNDAIRCAIEMQHCTQDYNQTRIDAEKVLLCVGIGYGEVLRVGDADIFGAEVNAACKLGEDTAKAREILITGAGAREARLPEGVTLTPIDSVPAGADAAFKLNYVD
ncbi:MAG: adenylate/guanylate cyclase domain-containing protein [Betaproteobacteria bacterium]|nr:adenylate/guanylate cyclase domain-containing protein [Betaproteobacteria bacterium]